jgi:hypothetical protein
MIILLLSILMICSWIWTSTHPASYKVCTIVSQLRISSTQDKWITDSQVAGPCCARANCFKFARIWRGRDVWVQSEWSKLPVSLIHQTVKLIHLWSINIRTRDRARYSAKAHRARLQCIEGVKQYAKVTASSLTRISHTRQLIEQSSCV